MAIQLPNFGAVREALLAYQRRQESSLSGVQSLLTTEALQRLADIELLATRIQSRCAQILVDDLAEARTLVDHLRATADPSSELGEWFAARPRVTVGLAFGGTTLDGRVGDGRFETLALQELRLDTELFYYLAHRFCTCLQRSPGMKQFECRPIAIIRNQLLEHPEKASSGVVWPTFAYGEETGPILKGMKSSDQTGLHADAGFVENCRTLLEAVRDALDAAADQQ